MTVRLGESAISNWHQTTGAFIRTKLYSVYVMDYLPYFVFFVQLKKVLNRNRTPSCSAVTDICWEALWLSLLCQEGMYHDCDRGIQRKAQTYHANNDFNELSPCEKDLF